MQIILEILTWVLCKHRVATMILMLQQLIECFSKIY